MNALSDALPKIDFSYYRKMVSDPALVDKLQKEVRINYLLVILMNIYLSV